MAYSISNVGSGISKVFMTIVSNPEARAFVLALAPTAADLLSTRIKESHETARHCSEHKKELLAKEVDTIYSGITRCDEEMSKTDPKSQRYQDLMETKAELMQMLKAAFHDIRYYTDSIVASATPVVYTE